MKQLEQTFYFYTAIFLRDPSLHNQKALDRAKQDLDVLLADQAEKRLCRTKHRFLIKGKKKIKTPF